MRALRRIDTPLVVDYLRYGVESARMDAAYAAAEAGWSGEPAPRFRRLRVALAFVAGLLPTLVCAVRGHAIEDDSYGGPESGCMAGHCTRCGWSFHHTLY